MKYQGKKVAVLGAGLSGTAAAFLLHSEGADVTVLDSAGEATLLKSIVENLRAQGVKVRCGSAAEDDSAQYDFVVLSPGIDPASPLATNFSSRNIETMGELELGWRSVDAPVIAITGTNGKTTTTELLAQMLNACGQPTIACGNIGKPLSEVALENRDLDVLTVEVSSFQLETIRTFRPSTSVWLNFAPDHLDRYRSVAEYRAAKLRIFENQTADDVAVVNAGETLPKIAARIVTFSAYANRADFRLEGGSIVYQDRPVLRMAETKLRGSHNIENLMATLAVGLTRGLSFEQMVPPLCAYEPQPHRCEFVRDVGGVTYINDSKATNLDAVEKGTACAGQGRDPDRRRKGQGVHFRTTASRWSRRKSGPRCSWGRWRDGSSRIGRAPFPARSHIRWPMRSSAPVPWPSPVRLFCFLPEPPPSTCSKATPIAAINFVPSCTLCPNKIMKLPTLFARKKLRATTARRALGPAEMDYEEMSEPNMKLSRALLIVLVLHVVAVAGIVAFNAIKTRQGPRLPASTAAVNTKAAPLPSVKSESAAVITSTRSEEPKAAKVPAKPVVKEERKSEQAKAETNPVKSDPPKTYVVAKGDNPVSIAKKLKISYDDLMAVNHIDDPHKLKVGQKLIVPAKTTKPKKGD